MLLAVVTVIQAVAHLVVVVATKENKAKILIFLTGLCFFLSALEVLIPKPIPFFRLGLANLAVLIAIGLLPLGQFVLLLFLKVIGQGILSGTLFSYVFLFSLAGTLTSGLVMYVLSHLSRRIISYIGISCAGAFCSNLMQLLLSYFFIFGEGTIYFAPFFLLLGVITSTILGQFINMFVLKSTWYKLAMNSQLDFNIYTEPTKLENNKTLTGSKLYIVLLSFILILTTLFLYNNVIIKFILFTLALSLCILKKQKILILNILIFGIFIVFFNLFPETGKILFPIFSLNVTSEALLRGVNKFLMFQTLLLTSKWFLSYNFNLKGKIGKIINESLTVFQKLLNSKSLFNPKDIINSIDSILLNTTNTQPTKET